MIRPWWTYWRRWLWVYRSANGGWCVWVLSHGFYLARLD